MLNKSIIYFFFFILFDNTFCYGDVCLQPLVDPGICRASIPRYGFDIEEGRCREFVWGGCDDNSNNFEQLEECQAVCEKK